MNKIIFAVGLVALAALAVEAQFPREGLGNMRNNLENRMINTMPQPLSGILLDLRNLERQLESRLRQFPSMRGIVDKMQDIIGSFVPGLDIDSIRSEMEGLEEMMSRDLGKIMPNAVNSMRNIMNRMNNIGLPNMQNMANTINSNVGRLENTAGGMMNRMGSMVSSLIPGI